MKKDQNVLQSCHWSTNYRNTAPQFSSSECYEDTQSGNKNIIWRLLGKLLLLVTKRYLSYADELNSKSTLNKGKKRKDQSVAKRKQSSSVHLRPSERLDFGKWKLPNNFGVVLNKILTNRGSLNEANLSMVYRRVVDSIEEFSLCSCGNFLRMVVQQMFATNPSIQINPKDPVSSSVKQHFNCTNIKYYTFHVFCSKL